MIIKVLPKLQSALLKAGSCVQTNFEMISSLGHLTIAYTQIPYSEIIKQVVWAKPKMVISIFVVISKWRPVHLEMYVPLTFT